VLLSLQPTTVVITVSGPTMNKRLLLPIILLVPAIILPNINREVIKQYPDKTPMEIVYRENGTEIAREFIDEKGNIKTTGRIPDCSIVLNYPNKTKIELTYRNNHLWAEKIYSKNGSICQDYNYFNGKRNGLSQTYYKSGKLLGKFNYSNGLLEGITTGYYETGELQTETLFKNNKINGLCKEYYQNGKIKVEIMYKNDKYDGIMNMYRENGQLIKTQIFKEGKLIKTAP